MSEYRIPLMPDASGNSITMTAEVFEVNYNHAVYNEIVQIRKMLEELLSRTPHRPKRVEIEKHPKK